MTTGGVSTLAQLTTQLNRFDTLSSQFGDLQRALASGKKTTRFEGLGDDALSSLRFRNNIQENTQYSNNIDRAIVRIRAADNSLSLIQTQTKVLREGFNEQPLDGPADLSNLQAYAAKLLEVTSGNLNEQIDGRFVFAGADFTSQPYNGNQAFSTQVADDVTDWLDGTITTDQFIALFDGYTDADIGFSAEVITAGNVSVTADDNFKVDYTVKANDGALRDLLVISEVITALREPTETDVPTEEDLQRIIDVLALSTNGVDTGIENSIVTLKASEATLQETQNRHAQDNQTLQTLIDDIENVDITETAVRLQNIQLQLEASFSVSAAAASLSLLDFI